MADAVDLAGAASTRVAAWRIEEGRLVLSIEGEPRVLRCACERCHWMVETREHEGRALLAVWCHGCGRGGVLPLAAPAS